MNQNTIKAITAVMGMVNPALGVIGTFISALGGDDSKVTKVTGVVQDAAKVIGAFAPLIEQFGRGEELDLEDARVALSGADGAHAALAKFDALIAAKGG